MRQLHTLFVPEFIFQFHTHICYTTELSRPDPCSVDFGPETPKFWFENRRGFLGGFFPPVFSKEEGPKKSTKKSTAKFTREFGRKNSPRISAEAFSWQNCFRINCVIISGLIVLRAMGFWECSNMAKLDVIPLALACALEVRYPQNWMWYPRPSPKQDGVSQRYLHDTIRKRKICATPPHCGTISEGYWAIRGASRTGPLSPRLS